MAKLVVEGLQASAIQVRVAPMTFPYSIPSYLPPNLERVLAYWKGLLRGGATMPFWDDARLTDLPDLADRLVLIDAFDRPERFRFASVGHGLASEGLEGEFLDEVELAPPFEFLRSQCAATTEAAGPTYFHFEGPGRGTPARAYGRLLLPMWGDGRIGMLLGAVDFS